ncbi:MAG TPA: YciI family protein, partial [Propionibacteriaceae bacterium]|nr:YciI family protein [Propionibacteriaceae bacterium]
MSTFMNAHHLRVGLGQEAAMKYVLRYTMADGVDPQRLREVFPDHRRHWEAYREDGTLVAIGPMEDPADGALSVFTTREAAEEFARADPFVTSGVV